MDPIKKQKVKFFDIKLLVINAIDTKVRKQFGGDFTFEDELLFIAGLSAGEHDATIMAWREKVRHDVVRPTTVIKRWGSDKLLTFGGDESLNEPIEPVEIAARDFHAFARVMPHAEFPSGSSCICTAYGELTDAWTKFLFNDTVKDMHVGGEQDGFGCEPGVDPEILVSLGCESDFTVPDMKTLIHECSQSRLWGGFHFRAAVTEGEKMCAGVGDRAFELIKQVKNGSTFGSTFRLGDPRPVCQDPNYSSTNGDGDYSSTNGGSPSAATKTVDFWAMMFSAAATSLFFYFAL